MMHEFLFLALDGCKWSASRPGSFIPGERKTTMTRRGNKSNLQCCDIREEEAAMATLR